MQEDNFPAAEKILSDIESVFKKDPKLKIFEILPITLNENKSPVVHMEHCLGLDSWCVPHVYCHAYNHVMSVRQNKRKREEYNRINRLLMGVLIINPDVTSFWNMRKELIMLGKLDPYFELHFTSVTLSRKPKCADIFSHRKWIIKKLLKDFPADPGLLTNELHICEMAADHYSNNYHAWTHRIWCLSQGSRAPLDVIATYQREWIWSENWVSAHVSDYSGFQYRQHLLSNLIKLSEFGCFEDSAATLLIKVDQGTELFLKSVCRENVDINVKDAVLPLRLVLSEYLLNSDLIKTFPGHEALWCHRRFILFSLKGVIFSYIKDCCKKVTWGYIYDTDHLNSDGIPLEKDKKIDSNISDRFAMLLSMHEESFLIKCSKGLSSREVEYSNKHRMWIEKVLKMQLPSKSGLLK